MSSKLTLLVLCVIFNVRYAIAGKSSIAHISCDHDDSIKLAGKQKKWYLPHFIPVQYAGNIGFISSGVGYVTRKNNYELSLLYGYTPASVAAVRIHTITAKNVFNVYRLHLNEQKALIPYAALGVSIEAGGRSFLSLPSTMPKGYYDWPKSLHMIASTGLKLRHINQRRKLFRGKDFFLEATSTDAYIWYKLISNEIKFRKIISLSFGINLLLK